LLFGSVSADQAQLAPSGFGIGQHFDLKRDGVGDLRVFLDFRIVARPSLLAHLAHILLRDADLFGMLHNCTETLHGPGPRPLLHSHIGADFIQFIAHLLNFALIERTVEIEHFCMDSATGKIKAIDIFQVLAAHRDGEGCAALRTGGVDISKVRIACLHPGALAHGRGGDEACREQKMDRFHHFKLPNHMISVKRPPML